MDNKVDLSLDEIIALNKRQKSSRGDRRGGRGTRGGSRVGRKFAERASTSTVQAVRRASQQSAFQTSKRARANLLSRRRNISATVSDDQTASAVPARNGGRKSSGRGVRRGRGRQPQGTVAAGASATRGRGGAAAGRGGAAAGRGGAAAGRGGAAAGRGRSIGTRIRRTATKGFVTTGKAAQKESQQKQTATKESTAAAVTQHSSHGKKSAEPKSIQISIVQDVESEPMGVELSPGFAVSHHTTKLLNDRFMPPNSIKTPRRLILPNGRSVSYQD